MMFESRSEWMKIEDLLRRVEKKVRIDGVKADLQERKMSQKALEDGSRESLMPLSYNGTMRIVSLINISIAEAFCGGDGDGDDDDGGGDGGGINGA
uniref:SAP domain-containing protein n=1 Tax=Syphacia muris TaxID=451379 RepID=A0A0N5AKC6_9BILA